MNEKYEKDDTDVDEPDDADEVEKSDGVPKGGEDISMTMLNWCGVLSDTDFFVPCIWSCLIQLDDDPE